MRADRHGLAALGWHPDSAESQLYGILGCLMCVAFALGIVVGAVLMAVL